jgi:F-box protein 7
MRLRLRSMDGGGAAETHRLDVPPTATLADVGALLAAKLSAARLVPAESVRFSLNRCDELDPAPALPDLGLASGDLLYFTLSPLGAPTPPAPAPRPNPSPSAAPTAKAVVLGSSSQTRAAEASATVATASDQADVVMVEAVRATDTNLWSSFVLTDLKREMQNLAGAEGTVTARLFAALHAALLDAGFCTSNPMGPRLPLPQGWPSSGATAPLIIKYTIPAVPEDGKAEAVLNFSVMGNFIMVYGCVLPGAQSEMCRLCLELPKLEPLLYLGSEQLSRAQERGVLELWRLLKDDMCLPLMVSLCQLNGLRLPPCFMALPAELKTRIMEFVPGVDLARVECTCKEMRVLVADDNLWNKLVRLVHGEGSRGTKSAKARFADTWLANKRRLKRPSPTFWNYGWGNPPLGPHRFPVIGGDSDRLPFTGNHGSLGVGYGNRRRNVSPNCNLGGGRNFF